MDYAECIQDSVYSDGYTSQTFIVKVVSLVATIYCKDFFFLFMKKKLVRRGDRPMKSL